MKQWKCVCKQTDVNQHAGSVSISRSDQPKFKNSSLLLKIKYFQIKSMCTILRLNPNSEARETNTMKYRQEPELVPFYTRRLMKGKACETNRQNGRDLKVGYHKVLCAHPAAVLQHGGGQHSPRHVGHLIAHFELELLHKRVRFVVGTAHLQARKRWRQ